MADFRIVNTGIDLADGFLDLTQRTIMAVTGAARDGLGVVKANLPDIPFVSEPTTPGAFKALPPSRLRAALPAAGGTSFQIPGAAQGRAPGQVPGQVLQPSDQTRRGTL